MPAHRPVPPVPTSRRSCLRLGLRAALAAGLGPLVSLARAATELGWARAWNAGAFAVRGETAVIAALGWRGAARPDSGVTLSAPEIAESGAVVPVEVRSTLPGTRRIALLVLDNPNTLAADFHLSPALLPRVGTRLKLADTTTVVALVEADGGLYSARQEVKVTVGGCGG